MNYWVQKLKSLNPIKLYTHTHTHTHTYINEKLLHILEIYGLKMV